MKKNILKKILIKSIKTILVLLAALVTLIIITALVLWFLLSGPSGKDGYTGDEAGQKIQMYLGKNIPDSAGNFYYKQETWTDFSYYAGMTIPQPDVWELIKGFRGMEKSTFKKADGYLPVYGLEEKQALWSISELKEPVYCCIKKEGTSTLVYYDFETERLLIFEGSF